MERFDTYIYVPSDQNSFGLFVQAEYIAKLLRISGNIYSLGVCIRTRWTCTMKLNYRITCAIV